MSVNMRGISAKGNPHWSSHGKHNAPRITSGKTVSSTSEHQLGQTRRYQLLSYSGFRITLVPPDQGAIAAFGDIAGNLDEDWELPMDGRTSLIRREMTLR